MKKIFISLIVIMSLFIGGCGNSLDVPKIEGTYEEVNMFDSDTIWRKNTITIAKIGKNKYSVNIESEGQYSNEKISAYQEVEILEVKKDREKSPTYYGFVVRELTTGKGTYQDKNSNSKEFNMISAINKVKLVGTAIEFYPKSATEPKDEVSVSLYFDSKYNGIRGFRGTKI